MDVLVVAVIMVRLLVVMRVFISGQLGVGNAILPAVVVANLPVMMINVLVMNGVLLKEVLIFIVVLYWGVDPVGLIVIHVLVVLFLNWLGRRLGRWLGRRLGCSLGCRLGGSLWCRLGGRLSGRLGLRLGSWLGLGHRLGLFLLLRFGLRSCPLR